MSGCIRPRYRAIAVSSSSLDDAPERRMRVGTTNVDMRANASAVSEEVIQARHAAGAVSGAYAMICPPAVRTGGQKQAYLGCVVSLRAIVGCFRENDVALGGNSSQRAFIDRDPLFALVWLPCPVSRTTTTGVALSACLFFAALSLLTSSALRGVSSVTS